MSTAEETELENQGSGDKAGTFGGLSPREASLKAAEARKEKRKAREQTAEENALTFRQRLGVSLSKLSQQDLDKRVKEAKAHELVRFADQAFGKPTEAEPDKPTDEGLAALTREQRASLRAMLTEDEANPLDEVNDAAEGLTEPDATPPPPLESESRESHSGEPLTE